jgi:hypothetical protein
MLRRFVIFLVVLAALLALADRGMAAAAGSATASTIKLHEGLAEKPSVTFRGFPFVTQAVRGDFQAVDVTVRDLERGGVTFDRIDAHLEGVKVSLRQALRGRVTAVPVKSGDATIRITYGDLQTFLAGKAGNLRLVSLGGTVYVRSTFGIPGAGTVEVEGAASVKVVGDALRVTVSNARRADGSPLVASVATAAATRSSFSIPVRDLPFGIELKSATLTDTALVVEASAEGIVVDVRS